VARSEQRSEPAAPRRRPGVRERSAARREVLVEFRAQVRAGTYRPSVDDVASELALWLLHDGMPSAPPARH
jgi:hypothetical protein